MASCEVLAKCELVTQSLVENGTIWFHGFLQPQMQTQANGFLEYLFSSHLEKERFSNLWVVGGKAKHLWSLV